MIVRKSINPKTTKLNFNYNFKNYDYEDIEFITNENYNGGWSWGGCATGAYGSVLMNSGNIASMTVFGPWWAAATAVAVGSIGCLAGGNARQMVVTQELKVAAVF